MSGSPPASSDDHEVARLHGIRAIQQAPQHDSAAHLEEDLALDEGGHSGACQKGGQAACQPIVGGVKHLLAGAAISINNGSLHSTQGSQHTFGRVSLSASHLDAWQVATSRQWVTVERDCSRAHQVLVRPSRVMIQGRSTWALPALNSHAPGKRQGRLPAYLLEHGSTAQDCGECATDGVVRDVEDAQVGKLPGHIWQRAAAGAA